MRSLKAFTRLRRGGALLLAATLHLLLALAFGRSAPESRPAEPVIVEAVLVPRPSPAPEPPAEDHERAASPSGGAPAAPSRLHVPPRVVDRPVEVIAPPVQAPEPDPFVVGLAPIADPLAGRGQGGQGAGDGMGVGDGSGSGGSAPPRMERLPSRQEILSRYPRQALERRRGGRATLVCRIGLDQRLQACAVREETPRGQGFGDAALSLAPLYRFRPPVRDGRPVEGHEIVVGVEFSPR